MRARYMFPGDLAARTAIPRGRLARQLLHLGLAVSVIALAGCDGWANYLDPYQKPYAWHPTGAPTANLAAQLVNPHDLVTGRGTTEGDAKEDTLAIQHVWQDNPKSITPGSAGGGAPSGTGSSPGSSGAGSGASGGGTGASGGSGGTTGG